MKQGEWYKVFGDSDNVTYYHVLNISDEVVKVEAFEYYSLLRRVESISQYGISAKDWMEREAENSIHPVPRTQVPFLIGV